MEHCRMTSRDLVQDNIDAVGRLFPSCLKEVKGEDGTVTRQIDFEVLKQELSREVIQGRPERYEFNWSGKRAAALLANTPIEATLRPCREESVNFDTTENLYIEGDNLDVLKLLCDNYRGKIKMIYIDPPYNTGNDFVYEDDYAQSEGEYRAISGDYDDQGNRLVKNSDSSGRFHTDWLNMIYPRLKIAQKLLADDGVIFISIDDNEVANLKKVCDEVFGAENFVAQLVWKKKYTGGKGTTTFVDYHEYILSYARQKQDLGEFGMARPESEKGKFTQKDEYYNQRGSYYTRPLKSNLDYRPTLIYPIELPDGSSVTTQWICAKETYEQLKKEGRIEFKCGGGSQWPVYKKFYEMDGGGEIKIPSFIECSSNNDAKEELKKIFNIQQTRDLPFQTPKPTDLLNLFALNFCSENDVILDFFSGSASMAHSVMLCNAEDGGHRKFIMVQIPEACAEDSEAAKAGYKNICEIGKERIRRAGRKIAEANAVTAPNLDVGFRVLKLDSSNMEDVYYRPSELTQDMLGMQEDNVKRGRTAEDLLFQVMLEKDIPLSSRIERETVSGKTIFNVADGYLLACFDTGVTDEVVTAIAKKHPVHAVFRDAGMASDSTAINFEQLFATYSPDTKRSII